MVCQPDSEGWHERRGLRAPPLYLCCGGLATGNRSYVAVLESMIDGPVPYLDIFRNMRVKVDLMFNPTWLL